jgi:hypothetical protein
LPNTNSKSGLKTAKTKQAAFFRLPDDLGFGIARQTSQKTASAIIR